MTEAGWEEQTEEDAAKWSAWLQRQAEAAASVAGYGPPEPSDSWLEERGISDDCFDGSAATAQLLDDEYDDECPF